MLQNLKNGIPNLPLRCAHTGAQKCLDKEIHYSIFPKSKELEMTQMSTNWKLVKVLFIWYSKILCSDEKE